MPPKITVCTAALPGRTTLLRQAFTSAMLQTLRPEAIVVEFDHAGEGAAAVKNRALYKVATPLVAWLDDDDVLKPDHLRICWEAMERTGADVVYPWYDILTSSEIAKDPRPECFGRPFDAEDLLRRPYIPTTALFDARLAKAVGGFGAPEGSGMDDWGLWLRMYNAGAVFHHVPVRTWLWRMEGQNTSGNPAKAQYLAAQAGLSWRLERA